MKIWGIATLISSMLLSRCKDGSAADWIEQITYISEDLRKHITGIYGLELG